MTAVPPIHLGRGGKANGPNGDCGPECVEARFPSRCRPLPDGWSVWWHAEHEHYVGHGPNGEESAIVCCRWAARRWVFDAAAVQGESHE